MKNLIKAAFIAIVLSMSLATPAAAEPLEDGQVEQPVPNKDVDAAVKSVIEQTRNDWKAQNPLNEPYDAYQRQDYATAFRLFRPLAEQGNAVAQMYLGMMYEGGEGVLQDYPEAMGLYLKASEKGILEAQFRIGGLYAAGHGVALNYIEAMKWYLKAAEGGHELAPNEIGHMYELGNGVPQDNVQAYKWYSIGINIGSASGASRLANILVMMPTNNRDRIAVKMTPEQIAEGQRLAREWKPVKSQAITDSPEITH